MYNSVDSVLFNSTSANFLNTNNIFLVGYHWTNESSISRAILATQNNVYAQYMMINSTTPDLNLIQKNAYLMVEGVDANYKEGVFSHVLGDTGILNARYFSFKPNMKINLGDDQYAILAERPHDQSHPIFGFQMINPLISISQNRYDPNYSFLVIPDTNLVNQELFSNPWGSEYLNSG